MALTDAVIQGINQALDALALGRLSAHSTAKMSALFGGAANPQVRRQCPGLYVEPGAPPLLLSFKNGKER